MLSLILAEAALETVPKVIVNHISVLKHANKKGKSGQEILLDRSYHHRAMNKLEDAGKRGRPDLVHFALLEAMSTPLYQKGMLEIYVHTIIDKVIFFHGNIRLPKSYFRFEGLMEELFKYRQVTSDTELLMEVKDISFIDLLNIIKPLHVIGMSQSGIKLSVEEVARRHQDKSVLVIGGFPHNHFSSKVYSKLDNVYSINEYGLEANVVIARVLYEYEKKLFKY
ncbi:MAG: ribosome biogenesis protein [Thaumarchaeota archaeon]|nr:ribosome biogenesis protein [Nitrososphaerota archaeon]